jgi:hypothetical protein
MEEQQVVPADKGYRRRVLLWGAVLTVAGAIGLVVAHRQFQAILELADRDLSEAVEKALGLATFFAWLTGLSVVGIGLWFGRLAWKILRCDQYPPPGAKVIKDTPVRTGSRARRIAAAALAACALFVPLGIAAGWLLYRLAAARLE